MRQVLIFAGSVVLMLGWVWLFGAMVSGSASGGTTFFRAWWRVIKWTIVFGLVVALIALQVITPP